MPPLVAIGASAGGPAALVARCCATCRGTFRRRSSSFSMSTSASPPGMADWLDQHIALPVRLAAEGDQPLAGQVLLAGTGDHLVFKAAERLGYTPKPADYVYRPSVDVFFHSVVPIVAGRDGRRAADRHGIGRRDRPEGAARRRAITPSPRTAPPAPSTACRRRPPRSSAAVEILPLRTHRRAGSSTLVAPHGSEEDRSHDERHDRHSPSAAATLLPSRTHPGAAGRRSARGRRGRPPRAARRARHRIPLLLRIPPGAPKSPRRSSRP